MTARLIVPPLAVVAAWAYGMGHLYEHITTALAVIQ